MAQWKYHVILPNGEEYLTETLAEARALEAQFGRSAHLPMRQKVESAPAVENPQPVATPAVAGTPLRKSPQRFVPTDENARDPRLPPVGTVLAKQGLIVVFDVIDGIDVYHVVAPTRSSMRGSYTSLSGMVRKYLKVPNYNGYQFFGLLPRLAMQAGRYTVAVLGEQALEIARQDHDTPLGDYTVIDVDLSET